MSTEFPDFTTAPAWLDRQNTATSSDDLVLWAEDDPDHLATFRPFTPLRTAEAWAREYSDERCGCLVLGCPCTTDPDASEVAPAEAWVQRIDRQQLENLIRRAGKRLCCHELDEPCRDYERDVDAVLAALPDLMGGEQA